MPLRQHLDPHAPRVMYVRRYRPNRAARDAWNLLGPQLGRQVLDKVHRHAMARVPGRE